MNGDLYKWDDKKGWRLDFNKVNKVIFDFKAIRDELDCDNEENGKISCGNCPFYGIHHCDVFRANIDTIHFMKDESTVDRTALAEGRKELEKENEELKEQIEKLKFLLDVDNNELIKENLELKAQIEDMKNVGNCEHSLNCARWVQQHISSNKVTCCKGCSEWELNK